jgi:hypothetical protein
MRSGHTVARRCRSSAHFKDAHPTSTPHPSAALRRGGPKGWSTAGTVSQRRRRSPRVASAASAALGLSGSNVFGPSPGRAGGGDSSGAACAVPPSTPLGCDKDRSVARFGRIDRSNFGSIDVGVADRRAFWVEDVEAVHWHCPVQGIEYHNECQPETLPHRCQRPATRECPIRRGRMLGTPSSAITWYVPSFRA